MKRQRILIVEDDHSLANMYRMSLGFSGFDVMTAHDGLAALQVIEEHHPDMIVLDLGLPRVHGDVILAELAANPETADIPVIVVTGSDITHAARQASTLLRKPCAPELLLSAVEHRLHAA